MIKISRLLVIVSFAIGIISCCLFINLKFININHSHDNYILEILSKESFRNVLNKLQHDHILSYVNKYSLYVFAKIYGYDQKIKAGEYLIESNITALQLIKQLIDGKVLLYKFTIVEGSRFEQIVNILQTHPKIQKTAVNYNNCQDVLQAMGRIYYDNIDIKNCEGLFLPDTYSFAKNTKDVVILRAAYDAMQTKLNDLWDLSNNNSLLKSKYEALILASIIEKETGLITEMAAISGVYHRRLQQGIKLQADPTVIYGLKIFDRTLSRLDLKQHSSYNTYLNKGLPPTPIATPSVAAIIAALNPELGDSLYFVANGNGGHTFSASFCDHKKAIINLKLHRQNNEQK